jgi:hypothetical protein
MRIGLPGQGVRTYAVLPLEVPALRMPTAVCPAGPATLEPMVLDGIQLASELPGK